MGGGFNNRPGTSQQQRYDEDDMWGKPAASGQNSRDKQAMNRLQNQLQGSNMSEMMGNNFQGSFNAANNRNQNANSNAGGGPGGGGVRADPNFAKATNKAQQIGNIE